MKIVADAHTHTIASTHAYSTVQEMARAAADVGLYAIAITDHCSAMPGAPAKFYFDNIYAIPDFLYGVRILRGAEANVINFDGELDLPQRLQNHLEWIVASMHQITLKGKPTVEKCTNAWLKVAQNPYVNVIGHSGTPEFEYDYERVIPVFAESGKLIEINNSSFKTRKCSVANCARIAQLCKKHNAKIIVNTDSHFSSSVGAADNALQMLKEIDFPKELIVNSDIDKFKEHLTLNGIKT